MTDRTLQVIALARQSVVAVRADIARGIATCEWYDFIEAVVELAGGRPNAIDCGRVEAGDWTRAGGDAECIGARGLACGHSYREHAVVPGYEWLYRLCDGRFVKL